MGTLLRKLASLFGYRLEKKDEPRKIIQLFAVEMEKALKEGDGWGGWGCLSKEYLIAEVGNHANQLRLLEAPADIVSACAHGAAYFMFIADNYGELSDGLKLEQGREL